VLSFVQVLPIPYATFCVGMVYQCVFLTALEVLLHICSNLYGACSICHILCRDCVQVFFVDLKKLCCILFASVCGLFHMPFLLGCCTGVGFVTDLRCGIVLSVCRMLLVPYTAFVLDAVPVKQ